MSETMKKRYEDVSATLCAIHGLKYSHCLTREEAEAIESLLDDLMAEREKMKELVKDRYEFPVNEWNEQLIQTINDTGCPAKIVLTRRKQSKGKED